LTRLTTRQGTNASEKDFALNGDGIVTPASGSPSKAGRYSIISYNQEFEDKVASSNTRETQQAPRRRNYNQISHSITKSAAQPLCGISPLAPEEIAKLVAESADRYGVDAGFAKAIAWTESRFDQQRNSSKGARGPMQLIPETAARFGVADICDPIANIDGGMRYLRSLIDKFGNPLLAAAAYNAGENRIYEHHGVPPYAETVQYVADVVNYQLGLPRPAKPSARHASSPHQASIADTPDVMGATHTAKFVGGVMQF
jgi:soluble lytic murein transglycosylase-like protein